MERKRDKKCIIKKEIHRPLYTVLWQPPDLILRVMDCCCHGSTLQKQVICILSPHSFFSPFFLLTGLSLPPLLSPSLLLLALPGSSGSADDPREYLDSPSTLGTGSYESRKGYASICERVCECVCVCVYGWVCVCVPSP